MCISRAVIELMTGAGAAWHPPRAADRWAGRLPCPSARWRPHGPSGLEVLHIHFPSPSGAQTQLAGLMKVGKERTHADSTFSASISSARSHSRQSSMTRQAAREAGEASWPLPPWCPVRAGEGAAAACGRPAPRSSGRPGVRPRLCAGEAKLACRPRAGRDSPGRDADLLGQMRRWGPWGGGGSQTGSQVSTSSPHLDAAFRPRLGACPRYHSCPAVTGTRGSATARSPPPSVPTTRARTRATQPCSHGPD